MHMALHHHPTFSIVSADGALTASDGNGLADLLCMVPPDHALVLDLLAATGIDADTARLLADEFRRRAPEAPLAVVIDDPDVALVLVLHDVDRWAAFVRDRDDAVSVVTGLTTSRR